tara:strand:+ start:2974 stop:3216 length:243 start_codon:yes stop_codon:yes gene_type:complete
MTNKYEHKYMVFNTSDGPKIINETLNTYGSEGWILSTMITVGGGQHIVAWMTKETKMETPDPKKSKDDKVTKLWTAGEKE